MLISGYHRNKLIHEYIVVVLVCLFVINGIALASPSSEISPIISQASFAVQPSSEYGIQIFGDIIKDRTTVLFIHGMDGDPDDFEEFLDKYSGKYNIALFSYDITLPLEEIAVRLREGWADLKTKKQLKGKTAVIAYSYGAIVLRRSVVSDLASFKGATIIQLAPPLGGSATAIQASTWYGKGLLRSMDLIPWAKPATSVAIAMDPLGPTQQFLFSQAACEVFNKNTGPKYTYLVEDDPYGDPNYNWLVGLLFIDDEDRDHYREQYQNGLDGSSIQILPRNITHDNIVESPGVIEGIEKILDGNTKTRGLKGQRFFLKKCAACILEKLVEKYFLRLIHRV
jgi:hypothetical protein